MLHVIWNFCSDKQYCYYCYQCDWPTASVHDLVLPNYYSFSVRFVVFLNPLVLPATSSLTATYSLVIPPYLTPVVKFTSCRFVHLA